MNGIFLALGRSLASLTRVRIWSYLLVPTLLSLVGLVVLWLAGLDYLAGVLFEQPPLTWLAGWGALWLAHILASLGGWLVILSASYLLALLLTAIAVMPLLLRHLAASDYADVARMGTDSVAAATWNSVWAAVLFILGWLVTLPLWLIPGLGLVLPLFWMAWLNRRTFAYDALSVHATDDEWREIRRRHSGRLLMLGGLMALLTHVPVLGLFAPSLAALAYIHYCLEALRQDRNGAVVALPPKREIP